MKNDPRYTRILNRIRYKKSGVFGEKILDTHKCTESDLAEFYTLDPKSKLLYE